MGGGAAAILIYDSEVKPASFMMTFDAIKEDTPQIPAIMITKEKGEELVAHLLKERLHVKAVMDGSMCFQRAWMTCSILKNSSIRLALPGASVPTSGAERHMLVRVVADLLGNAKDVQIDVHLHEGGVKHRLVDFLLLLRSSGCRDFGKAYFQMPVVASRRLTMKHCGEASTLRLVLKRDAAPDVIC